MHAEGQARLQTIEEQLKKSAQEKEAKIQIDPSRPPTLLEQYQARRHRLISQLTEVHALIRELERDPAFNQRMSDHLNRANPYIPNF